MSILRESESIVHHTSHKDALVKILRNEQFKVNYCSERIYVDETKSVNIAVPMVSFADIRLSDYVRVYRDSKKIDEETIALGYYGDYAIGLTKKWARMNNIYPVCYVSKPESHNEVADNYVLKDLIPFAKVAILWEDKGGNVEEGLPNLASFCKHNIGYIERDMPDSRTKRHKYAFYNEHEYRYVPSNVPVKWNFFNNGTDYNEGSNLKKRANQALSSYLKFDLFEDVTAIVVHNDNNIEEIIKVLAKKKDEKSKDLSDEKKILLNIQYDIMLTRIITTKQLLTEV
jgi:hypothetical protein